MDMMGEYRIAAPRQAVWEGLNDPEVLKQSISGCHEIQRISDTELTAQVTIKVGPVKARFNGNVTLSDLNPPESYTITGDGKGGAAGFAKGGAKVKLVEDGEETVLTYEVHANVGGKLAQIGQRLIQSTAKKMADDFFGKFAAVVGQPTAPAEPAVAPAAEATPAASPTALEEPAQAPEPEPAPLPVEAEQPAALQAEPAPSPGPVATAVRPQPAPAAEPAPSGEPEPAPEPEPVPEAATATIDEPVAAAPAQTRTDAEPAPELPQEATAGGLNPLVWVAGVIVIALVLIWVFS